MGVIKKISPHYDYISKSMDNGHVKSFFFDFPNDWLLWADELYKLWNIYRNIYYGFGFELGLQRVRDLVILRP